MTDTTWALFLREVSGGAPGSEIAEHVGVSEATVSRWLAGVTVPKGRIAVDVARAYSQSPLSALVAAGHLTEDELGIPVAPPIGAVIQQFTATEIVEELHRRAIAGELD